MVQAQPNPKAAPEYYAFVLRLWRCSLQAADGNARIGFAALEHLIAYLIELIDAAAQPARNRVP